jgi:WD40 repeat protein
VIGGQQNTYINYFNSSTSISSTFSSGHTGPVNCLKLLDKSTYASGSNDKSVIIWNAITGAKIKTLTGHTNNVLCLELLGNGYLASGGEDDNIYIWNYTSSSTTYSYALTNAHGNNQQVNCIKQLSGYYFASATNGASNNLRVLY